MRTGARPARWWRLAAPAILAMATLAAAGPAAHAQSPGAAASPKVVTDEERRWQADRLFDEGRFDEARDAYLAVAQAFVTDPKFNRDLGTAFARSREPDLQKAIQYWTVSWRLDGKEDLKIEAARAWARLGQWKRGAALLLELAAQHPHHPEHWREAAELAEGARDWVQAEEWYRTFLKRRPADVNARIALARVLSATKDFDGAVAEYEAVLATSPRNTPARVALAQVLSWRGDFDASIRRYDEVLREQPANIDAVRGKAYSLLWAGRPRDARPLFERVLQRRPGDREVREALKAAEKAERDAAAGAAPAVDPLWAEVEDAFARRDGAAAVALLTRAAEAAPADRQLRRRLAQAHLLAGDAAAARAVLAKLRDEDRGDTDVLRELAGAQVQAGDFPAAIGTLYDYLALKPADARARVDVARVLSWSRRFDDATREYERVLAEAPDAVDAQVGRAQVDAWQGRYAEALTRFDRILADVPGQREAMIGKAQALFWMGRRREAMEHLSRVELQFPQDAEIATLVADLREADRRQTLAEMDTPSAIRHHEGQLAGRPGDPDLLRTLGDLHLRMGSHDRASDYYRRLTEARPGDPEAQIALARALSAGKSYDRAAALLREVVASAPTPARRVELAQVLTAARKYDEAVAIYREVIAASPDDVDARMGIARILSWDRKYAESLAEYEQVMRLTPDARDAQVEYARVHAWKGDTARALELFTALERKYPDDRDVLLGKGQSLLWSGRAREAQRVLVPLLAAHPKDRDVRVAVASCQLALGRGDLALQELEVAGAAALDDADVRLMRNLALRQLRPVLVLNVNPSRDSDDLEIVPGAATLYFSVLPRTRSFVRGTFIPSSVPTIGDRRGREGVFGSTVLVSPAVLLRGEVGANFGVDDKVGAIGSGGVTLQPAEDLRIDLDAGRQFINYLPLAVERNISRVLLRASADYRPGGRFHVHVDYFHGRYSDDNRANGGNVIVSRSLVKRGGLTLEAGYLFSLSGFADDPGNGYYAPSRLQRHAGLVNAYGRFTPRLGYTVSGTLGAERAGDGEAGYRPDGSIRFAFDVRAGERLGASLGYGYSRVATLSRTGAYASHAVTAGLEVGF